jgi:hypothetical protein
MRIRFGIQNLFDLGSGIFLTQDPGLKIWIRDKHPGYATVSST